MFVLAKIFLWNIVLAMGEFPYRHDNEPDARRHSEFKRAAPVLAAALAGLAVGTFFEHGQRKQDNRPVRAPVETAQPNCRAETSWRHLPQSTNWRFLAKLLNVDQSRAQKSEMALVICREGIQAADILNEPIEVAGHEGPCLPLDLMKDDKNPLDLHKEIFAVCAGHDEAV
jgi:hypothetical protein